MALAALEGDSEVRKKELREDVGVYGPRLGVLRLVPGVLGADDGDMKVLVKGGREIWPGAAFRTGFATSLSAKSFLTGSSSIASSSFDCFASILARFSLIA